MLKNESSPIEMLVLDVDMLADLADAMRKVSPVQENLLIAVFSLLIVFGLFGNILVIWTVLFNKHMQTANNFFVLNLAFSDLTLCVISIPFMVFKTLRHNWIFGDFLCRFAPFFQASNVFVSTFSITAIALHRYAHIVFALRIRQSPMFTRTSGTLIILACIWCCAYLLSSPLFFFNVIPRKPDFEFNEVPQQPKGLNHSLDDDSTLHFSDDLIGFQVTYCVERWPSDEARFAYSYTSLVIQYILPILIAGVAYTSIWWSLKKQQFRLNSHSSKTKNKQPTNQLTSASAIANTNISPVIRPALTAQIIEANRRRRNMNILLVSIAVIFAISWLPLNILNILSDSKSDWIQPGPPFYVMNAVCILFAMSSAVSNPFLYGFLNDNFKIEYIKLARRCFSKQNAANNGTSGNDTNDTVYARVTLLQNKNINVQTPTRTPFNAKRQSTTLLDVNNNHLNPITEINLQNNANTMHPNSEIVTLCNNDNSVV